MLLGSSISNTKKFFQRTLENFKFCFSPAYQKLPKTLPHIQFSCSVDNNPCYKDLEKFYSDFTKQWDSEKDKGSRRSKKKGQDHHQVRNASHAQQKKNMNDEKREECDKKGLTLTHQRGNGNCMVQKKLRELEMLDKSDVDYVLDIKEVLHYYSRLTCPLYLDIVDQFFMEIYSQFLAPV